MFCKYHCMCTYYTSSLVSPKRHLRLLGERSLPSFNAQHYRVIFGFQIIVTIYVCLYVAMLAMYLSTFLIVLS